MSDDEKVVKSVDTLIKNVRELAKEYPDHVYEPVLDGTSCSYVEGGPNNEGCIVGQASIGELVRKGITADECEIKHKLRLLNNDGVVVDYSEKKALWLNIVQNRQDDRVCWSEAVKEADKKVDIDV